MGETLTLALELTALRRVASPPDVVADARRWSDAVCVVTRRPAPVLTKFCRDHGVEHDYYPDPAPMTESLDTIRRHFVADRYVLVAAGEEGEDALADVWERRTVTNAAAAAGWELAPAGAADTPSDGTDPEVDPWSASDDGWP